MAHSFDICYVKDLVVNTSIQLQVDNQYLCFGNIAISDKQPIGNYILSGIVDDDYNVLLALGYLFCPSERAKFYYMYEAQPRTNYNVISLL